MIFFTYIALLIIYFFHITHTIDMKEAHNNLIQANEFFIQGDVATAYDHYKRLLQQFPHSTALLANTARAAYECNNNQEALFLLKKALELKPDNAELHYQYAICLLAAGNYAHGWPEYEWRWKKSDKKNIQFPYPLWIDQDICHKRLLLITEGDYGDVFQFIRFALILKKMGAHITVLAQPELLPLLQQQSYIDAVISTLPSPETIDYWISLMSIPSRLSLDIAQVTINNAYMSVDSASITRNQALINPHTFNIGICLHADPINDANRPPCARRSIDAYFLALFDMPSVTFYPLEKKAYGTSFDVVHGSFLDTAGLMMHLDLIITVDTAVAHLAGALGKPTWLLLPYKSDWRWMLDRNDTPWYPQTLLIRNNNQLNWHDLCLDVQKRIKQKAKEYI